MSSLKPYLTITQEYQEELPSIKGSRFIGIASPVVNESDVKLFIQRVKKNFPDARHWCWAFQLKDNTARFSDDGEPSGSAGKPILAPIHGRGLYDVAVVVVRYFGGVKLGVGGLVRAYSHATNVVLDAAVITKVTPTVTLNLCYQYDLTNAVATALAHLGLIETEVNYAELVNSSVAVIPEEIEMSCRVINEYTSGKVKITLPDE